jgi:hypothetical protein
MAWRNEENYGNIQSPFGRTMETGVCWIQTRRANHSTVKLILKLEEGTGTLLLKVWAFILSILELALPYSLHQNYQQLNICYVVTLNRSFLIKRTLKRLRTTYAVKGNEMYPSKFLQYKETAPPAREVSAVQTTNFTNSYHTKPVDTNGIRI